MPQKFVIEVPDVAVSVDHMLSNTQTVELLLDGAIVVPCRVVGTALQTRLPEGPVVYHLEPLPGHDFPIVCRNGCPEGYLGRHKFSCSLARPGTPQ